MVLFGLAVTSPYKSRVVSLLSGTMCHLTGDRALQGLIRASE